MRKIYNALAIIGTIIAISAIDTICYYTTEVMQNEPMYLWYMLAVGFVMVIPAVVYAICAERRKDKYYVFYR